MNAIANNWQGFMALYVFVLVGMWLSFFVKALRGSLWDGDVERNPFTKAFWSDLYLYFFVEKVGRTVIAIVMAFTTATGIANGALDVSTASAFKMMVCGVSAGFGVDLLVNRANWR